jgi:hypothetical protein
VQPTPGHAQAAELPVCLHVCGVGHAVVLQAGQPFIITQSWIESPAHCFVPTLQVAMHPGTSGGGGAVSMSPG